MPIWNQACENHKDPAHSGKRVPNRGPFGKKGLAKTGRIDLSGTNPERIREEEPGDPGPGSKADRLTTASSGNDLTTDCSGM